MSLSVDVVELTTIHHDLLSYQQQDITHYPLSRILSNECVKKTNENRLVAMPGCEYLVAKVQWNSTTFHLSDVRPPDPPQPTKTIEDLQSETSSTSATSSNHQSAQLLRANLLKKRKLPESKPFQLTFLGTGCATPSKHRNNASILLSNILRSSKSDDGLGPDVDVSVLLDCGEGVVNQIWVYCECHRDLFYRILRSIRMIWISHHHCDHIVGLTHLIEQISLARQVTSPAPPTPITIIGSTTVTQYYEFGLCCCGLDDNSIQFVDIQQTLYCGDRSVVSRVTAGFITQLTSVNVFHCPNAYAVVLEVQGDYKIAYSGDCRPNSNFATAGKNCDLLIHEATFDDSKQQDAEIKKHSTISEAMQIGQAMNSKHIVLTHFSQRYPSMSSLTKEESSQKCPSHRPLVYACDLMTFQYPSEIVSVWNEQKRLIEEQRKLEVESKTVCDSIVSEIS